MQQNWLILVIIALTLAVVWLTVTVSRLHADIAPLATSPLAGALSGIGT